MMRTIRSFVNYQKIKQSPTHRKTKSIQDDTDESDIILATKYVIIVLAIATLGIGIYALRFI